MTASQHLDPVGSATPSPATRQNSGEIHEHACIRCPLLRPDPAQRDRLLEICDNLVARIDEAQREGWLGEVEGLKVSLAAARTKLAQLTELASRPAAVQFGVPTIGPTR
jgi:hypothetical protein